MTPEEEADRIEEWEDRLADAQAKVTQAEAVLGVERSRRNRLVRDALAGGMALHAVARAVGHQRPAVRRMAESAQARQ